MSKLRESAMIDVIPNYKSHQIAGIYLFTNKSNNKVYVGQSSNIYFRYMRHRRSSTACDKYNRPIVSAFKKYGFDGFIFSIIEIADRELLTEIEQFYMNLYNSSSREYGYNACPAAGSCAGYKHSEETKRKVSAASTGRKHSEKTKILMSNNAKGRTYSEETIKKMSEASKGRFRALNLAGKTVLQICIKTQKLINEYPSISEASRNTGVHLSSIAHVCKKERKSAGGFKWEYS